MENFNKSHTIWVVDDDYDDQYIMELALQAFDPTIRVKSIFDGRNLFAALQESDGLPDLLLLDLNLRCITGFEVLEQIRHLPQVKQLPIIMLTTSSQESDAAKAKSLGATDFLSKADTYSALIGQVETLISTWCCAA